MCIFNVYCAYVDVSNRVPNKHIFTICIAFKVSLPCSIIGNLFIPDYLKTTERDEKSSLTSNTSKMLGITYIAYPHPGDYILIYDFLAMKAFFRSEMYSGNCFRVLFEQIEYQKEPWFSRDKRKIHNSIFFHIHFNHSENQFYGNRYGSNGTEFWVGGRGHDKLCVSLYLTWPPRLPLVVWSRSDTNRAEREAPSYTTHVQIRGIIAKVL